MNKLEVQQTGGFPLETNTLDFMQNAFRLLQEFGAMSGANTIISGCVENGNSVSDGVVFYNGEILPFHGGQKMTNVRVVEDQESRIFENGESKVVYKNRYMTFGSSGFGISWSSFRKPNTLLQLTDMINSLGAFPVGAIVMWSGAANAIPVGWKLCDGNDGTPNLKGRFLVGYDGDDNDYNAVGKVGGHKTITLTKGQLPAHDHTGKTDVDGEHEHQYTTVIEGNDSVEMASGIGQKLWNVPFNDDTSGTGEHDHEFTTDETGNGDAIDIRPSYYTICYIIKV